MPKLDNSRIFDALLCELSMYDIQTAQKNVIRYGNKTWIVLNFENAKEPIEIIYKILEQYTLSKHKYVNPLMKIKLQDKNYYTTRLPNLN